MCTYFFLSRPQFLKGLTCCSTQSFRLCCWKATSQIEHYHCLRSNSQLNKRQCQLIDLSQRYFSNKVPKNETKKELDIKRESPYAGLSAAEKVKEAGKDASYIAIIIAGIGVIGVVFYTVGKELFSSQSPAGVYSKALKKCQNNIEENQSQDMGLQGVGRRKQHVSSQEFMENGVKHMRVVFKIEGPYRKGTVHVEVFQDDSKKYQFKHVIYKWLETIDNGKSIDVIFMDYLKAFDTGPHKRLMNKLRAHGTEYSALKWVDCFLSDRIQHVSINNKTSSWSKVTSSVVFYTVGKELFSSQSPAGVYSKALKKCQNNIEVLDTLGEPITGHGTSGSRRRKQHVSSQEFMENGVKHMRVVFKIEGPYRKGTVHVEVFQDDSKKYQFKHVICELQGYPSRTIVIENNR
ncbi:TIM21 [Mytilus coruscus]|uniref:TIM21-like protein, mitochondrial n=1 Tax=Mytilus coruscus TaxID=42192 RepID=A0A6J8DMH9_MYTCO|nr:TIM21 [Mytilus coruscus]